MGGGGVREGPKAVAPMQAIMTVHTSMVMSSDECIQTSQTSTSRRCIWHMSSSKGIMVHSIVICFTNDPCNGQCAKLPT